MRSLFAISLLLLTLPLHAQQSSTPFQGQMVIWYPTGYPSIARAAIVTNVLDPMTGDVQLSCQSLPGDHAFYYHPGLGKTLSVPYAGGPVPALIRKLTPDAGDWWVVWGSVNPPTPPGQPYYPTMSPMLTMLPYPQQTACPSGSSCGWATVKIPRWTTVGQPGWVPLSTP
jgi:hypothetical protein